jgi:amino acid transporter
MVVIDSTQEDSKTEQKFKKTKRMNQVSVGIFGLLLMSTLSNYQPHSDSFLVTVLCVFFMFCVPIVSVIALNKERPLFVKLAKIFNLALIVVFVLSLLFVMFREPKFIGTALLSSLFFCIPAVANLRTLSKVLK